MIIMIHIHIHIHILIHILIGNASALSELVDNRPQGKINLYAQAANQNPPEPREPLTVHVSKGIVNVQVIVIL